MQLDRPIYVYMCVCTGTPLLTLRFADEECCDAGEGHVGESGRLCDIPHEPSADFNGSSTCLQIAQQCSLSAGCQSGEEARCYL